MSREIEKNAETTSAMSNIMLSPEAQLNGALAQAPEECQLRFALAVPQAAKLLDRLTFSIDDDKYSIVRDDLFVILAAKENRSVFSCAPINDIQVMVDEVVRVGKDTGNDPRTEGLFAGVTLSAIHKHGSNAFDRTELKHCSDASFSCITMFNSQGNFDAMREIVSRGMALAYVVLISDNEDGVMAMPIVYGRMFRKFNK